MVIRVQRLSRRKKGNKRERERGRERENGTTSEWKHKEGKARRRRDKQELTKEETNTEIKNATKTRGKA